MAIEHRQEALDIGGIAGLDDDIEDQAALAGGEIELVSILHLTTPLAQGRDQAVTLGVNKRHRPIARSTDDPA